MPDAHLTLEQRSGRPLCHNPEADLEPDDFGEEDDDPGGSDTDNEDEGTSEDSDPAEDEDADEDEGVWS